MYIYEESQALIETPVEQLFQRFVRSTPTENPQFGTTQNSGRSYFTASDVSSGFETFYLGFRGSNGYLNIVAVAGDPRVGAYAKSTLYDIAESLYFPGPAANLTAPEAAMKSWYDFISAGNGPALLNLACARARAAMAVMILGGKVITGQDPVQFILNAGRGFNFSNLRYQTVGIGPGGAAVRVGGNVVAPNGRVTPQYQYAANIGGSNVFFIVREDGAWRVCQSVRGGNS